MIDPDWFARRLARLNDVEGDIDQLASRIAAVRTLCFIAQRGDWIAGAAGWTEQAQALESRLSDALHAALAQRFVDRRLDIGRAPWWERVCQSVENSVGRVAKKTKKK